MIANIKNLKPETKEKFKLWFQEAKKGKQIPILYIIDNLVKNTKEWEEFHDKGIVGFLEILNEYDENRIDNALIQLTIRFKNNKINLFNSKNFNFYLEKIK